VFTPIKHYRGYTL